MVYLWNACKVWLTALLSDVRRRASWLLWPLETTKVSLGESQPLWYCGYFCNLPGAWACPRNGWGLKNVVGAMLFMQSSGSLLVGTGNIQKTVWPSFSPRYFGPRLAENDLKNNNLDSNIPFKAIPENRPRNNNSCQQIMLHHVDVYLLFPCNVKRWIKLNHG